MHTSLPHDRPARPSLVGIGLDVLRRDVESLHDDPVPLAIDDGYDSLFAEFGVFALDYLDHVAAENVPSCFLAASMIWGLICFRLGKDVFISSFTIFARVAILEYKG